MTTMESHFETLPDAARSLARYAVARGHVWDLANADVDPDALVEYHRDYTPVRFTDARGELLGSLELRGTRGDRRLIHTPAWRSHETTRAGIRSVVNDAMLADSIMHSFDPVQWANRP